MMFSNRGRYSRFGTGSLPLTGRAGGHRLARALGAALLLVASGAPGAVPVHAQETDPAPVVEFRDLSFPLPGPEWQRVEAPLEPGQVADGVTVTREEPLHRQEVEIRAHEADLALSRAEAAAQYFDGLRSAPVYEGQRDGFQTGEREINGATYPTLAQRFTPAAGTPIVDALVLLYLPADYEQRQRFYVLEWSDTHSATVPARGLEEFDGLVGSLAVRPVGEVLVADAFEDAAVGAFPDTSPYPDHYLRGYLDGEYMMQTLDPQWNKVPQASTAGRFADVSVAADVRFVTEEPSQLARVFCRELASKEGNSGYFLFVSADHGTFSLQRDDKGTFTTLLDWRPSPAIQGGGELNHLELACAGSRITASINGTVVGSVRDSTYAEGWVGFGAEAHGATFEARIDNFLVTQS